MKQNETKKKIKKLCEQNKVKSTVKGLYDIKILKANPHKSIKCTQQHPSKAGICLCMVLVFGVYVKEQNYGSGGGDIAGWWLEKNKKLFLPTLFSVLFGAYLSFN